MSKNKKENDIFDSVEDITSMQECTGLVARGATSDEEFDNLMSLQNFSPKSIKIKKDLRKGK